MYRHRVAVIKREKSLGKQPYAERKKKMESFNLPWTKYFIHDTIQKPHVVGFSMRYLRDIE